MLIGYLYGITSERKLVEELRMHRAWRWFTGLSFDQEIPHHSTFSKNRHGRFQESKLFEQLFEKIVKQCVEVGLVEGKHLSVDGSFVEANAAKESRIPRGQLVEAAQVHYSLREYLKELEQQNPVEEPVHEQDQILIPTLEKMYRERTRTSAFLGRPSGVVELDAMLGGIRESELWIAGGLPAKGKTSFGLEFAMTAGQRYRHDRQCAPVLFANQAHQPALSCRKALLAQTFRPCGDKCGDETRC